MLQKGRRPRQRGCARAGGSIALLQLATGLLVLLAASLLEGAWALTEYLDLAAVGRMERALDESIIIQASPRQLSKGGLWVTVEWSGVSDPTEGDFVAAYAPLDAQPDATAPIKYQYASAADPGHLQRGAGRVKFRLLEVVGGSYWFGFFRGNASHPVFAAKSGPVTVLGDGVHEPQGVHLALTNKADEMRVTWKTMQASFFYVPDAELPGSDEAAAADAVSTDVGVGVDGREGGQEEEGGVEAADSAAVAAAVVDDGEGTEITAAAAAVAPAAAADKGSRQQKRWAAAAVEGTQEVQYTKASDVGAAKGQLDVVEWRSTTATTGAFAKEDLCGEPATSVGWSDPGMVHSAVMRGLEPATAYTYRVGNAGTFSLARVCDATRLVVVVAHTPRFIALPNLSTTKTKQSTASGPRPTRSPPPLPPPPGRGSPPRAGTGTKR